MLCILGHYQKFARTKKKTYIVVLNEAEKERYEKLNNIAVITILFYDI